MISGNKAAVERAAELAKKRGAKRAILLPVSAPFHCALMQPAQDRLADELRALTFHAPQIPVMCNVDAAVVTTAEQARDALIRQVTGAVQWDKSMRALVALGVKNFVEVGPGKVLCGLMRQIDRSLHLPERGRRSLAAKNREPLQHGIHEAGLASCQLAAISDRPSAFNRRLGAGEKEFGVILLLAYSLGKGFG